LPPPTSKFSNRTLKANSMTWLLIAWFILLFTFAGTPFTYYFYLRHNTKKPWNLKLDNHYFPSVTMMVPMHNEEKLIQFKLENIKKLKYPLDKLQIILINDASVDRTLEVVTNFVWPTEFDVKVVDYQVQHGKTKALNDALPYVKSDIIVVSDSDAFIDLEILTKAMPYFADPSVGALISREELLKIDGWANETEKQYYDLAYGILKFGESKIHSTLIFHGGFAAYRASLIKEFNVATDDSGTALDIIQSGKRAILVPEAISYGVEFSQWKDKIAIKTRRASHNVRAFYVCLKLLISGKLLLPKGIAFPELFIYLFNPFIFAAFLIVTLILSAIFPVFLLTLLIITAALFIYKKTRMMLSQVIENNFYLFIAIMGMLAKKEIIGWKTSQDPRALLTRDLLLKYDLI
jgi:cellulose synthase/poly-beta-1,6-N-acetylglucosamine synthase-like glycosyltransferase